MKRYANINCAARGACVALLLLLATPPLGAQPELLIRLSVEDCSDVDRTEVERVLAAELGAHLSADVGSGLTQVAARCEGTRLVLEVTDPISRKTLRRRFDFGGVPAPGKSRLVAIAASELVLASWAELELNPAPRVAPEGDAPSPAAAAAVRQRLRLRAPLAPVPGELDAAETEPDAVEPEQPRGRWFQLRKSDDRMLRGMALASMRRFVKRDGTLWGGGARIGSEPLVATSWALDTLFETGTIRDTSGRGFEMDSWTVGGQLLIAGRLAPLVARIGIGLRAGVVASSPEASDASRGAAIAPWGWPFLASSLTLRFGQICFDVAGEGGYVALPVSQSGSTTTVLRGVWVSAQVGIGVIP